MTKLLDILRGICIGIANIIPGFSGGTMAVILHVYDRIVFGIADLTRHPLKVIKDLLFLILGIVLGFVIAIFTIAFMLKKFPMPTIMFFVGLIIGSMPSVFKEASDNNKTKLNYLFIIPAVLIIVGLPFIKTGDVSEELSFVRLFLLFLVGIISSATMVIPGVSGSLMLMAFGYYTLVLDNARGLMKNIFKMEGIKNPIIFMTVFTIGCLVGVIFVSKLIKLCVKKNRNAVYAFIFGLLLGSPVSIIYTVMKSDDYSINYHSVGMWVCSVLLVIIGISIPIIMEYLSKKYLPNQDKEIITENENLDDQAQI